LLDGRAIALDHPDPAVGEVHLMAALGTADHDFYCGIVEQLGDAASYDGRTRRAFTTTSPVGADCSGCRARVHY
jgi:hypothetical protein